MIIHPVPLVSRIFLLLQTYKADRLDVTDSAGNIKGIEFRSKLDKSLLSTLGADSGVDLEGLDLVKDLDGVLNVVLGGLAVNSQNKSVAVLNLLNSNLRVDVALDNLVSIKSGVVGNRLALVLGGSGKSKSLGSVEVNRGANLDKLLGVRTLNNGLLGVESLLLSGGYNKAC